MIGRSPRRGDWVAASEPIQGGLFSGTAIAKGTHGVVNSVNYGFFSSTVAVTFGGGLSPVDRIVPTHKLRIIRRGAGVERFQLHQSRLAVARAAIALFLCWPVIQWVAQYVWMNRGFDGITAAFAAGVLDSIGSYLAMFITDPIKALIYFGFLGLLGRFAWR